MLEANQILIVPILFNKKKASKQDHKLQSGLVIKIITGIWPIADLYPNPHPSTPNFRKNW